MKCWMQTVLPFWPTVYMGFKRSLTWRMWGMLHISTPPVSISIQMQVLDLPFTDMFDIFHIFSLTRLWGNWMVCSKYWSDALCGWITLGSTFESINWVKQEYTLWWEGFIQSVEGSVSQRVSFRLCPSIVNIPVQWFSMTWLLDLRLHTGIEILIFFGLGTC